MALAISTWATNPITINGVLTAPEWGGAGQMPIPAGFLKVKNDANFCMSPWIWWGTWRGRRHR